MDRNVSDARREAGGAPSDARLRVPSHDEVEVPPRDDEVSRRTALKLLSATALLGVGGVGCTRKPKRHIVSLAETPEYQLPGIPLRYASTFTDGTVPYGIMVKAVDGRPVKVEGLPSHPLNRGTSSAAMQASLLSLYDPERLRAPRAGKETLTWEAADRRIVEALRGASSVVLLTRSLLGPSERALVQRFLALAQGARHLVWEAASDAERRAAWREVYGADGVLVPDLSRARVILSVDADFLGTDGDVLTATREFAKRRVVDADPQASRMSRLYVAESAMTITGSKADHRLPTRPSAALALVEALRDAIAGETAALEAFAKAHGHDARVLGALAADLGGARGEALVLAGPHLPRAVHAAVASLNQALGAHGTTLAWNPQPSALAADDPAVIAAAFEAGPDVAILMDVNPAYDAPGGDFAAHLAQAKLTVGHGLTANETLALCSLALPSAHNLESWNDAAPTPGVESLCQPLIRPLFDGRQAFESLLVWTKALAPGDAGLAAAKDWHDHVKTRWTAGVLGGAADPERAWEDALRNGFVGEPRTSPFPTFDEAKARALVAGGAAERGDAGLDVVLLPHFAVHDGRWAGNAWLQELPDPASKIVWDNAAQLSPGTAKRLGVAGGEWITIRVGARTLDMPVLPVPGTAPDVVVLTLGHGRRQGAGVGDGVGFNVSSLLDAGAPLRHVTAASVTRAQARRGQHHLVRTQRAFSQADRHLVIDGTREEYLGNASFPATRRHIPPLEQLDPAWDYSKGHKWAMAIDLSACTGCTACTIACQAENNIMVVGKDECDKGRVMSWIRIDRYEAGDEANPTVYQQPMLCQHCDNAPCETVCPVNASAHSPEGLNEQVYNRCVGTRYCANNCPYKVRRFNYFNYTKREVDTAVQELLHNPQVTVRTRGVMEKCTFCVQRINAVKFEAQNAGKPVADGQIKTACQQACPAQAIHFGDLNDPGSEIARKRASGLGYHVLEELNVRPNVTYLAQVRNPNPSVAKPGGDE